MKLISLFSKKGSCPAFKRKTKRVAFEIMAPKANNVKLTGDFLNWDKEGLKMKKTNKGLWKIGVSLCSGRYEYKFIVDDEWRIDPQNNEIAETSLGSINSIKEIVI